jgi:predicted GIY-YIG superfamily endonuclease
MGDGAYTVRDPRARFYTGTAQHQQQRHSKHQTKQKFVLRAQDCYYFDAPFLVE